MAGDRNTGWTIDKSEGLPLPESRDELQSELGIRPGDGFDLAGLFDLLSRRDRSNARARYCCELWSASDADLADLFQLLGSGGVAIFVEPTAGPAPIDRIQRLAASVDRSRLGYDFTVDVPARLRHAGLTPTTVLRVTKGTLGRRTYVVGAVRRIASSVLPEHGEDRPEHGEDRPATSR